MKFFPPKKPTLTRCRPFKKLHLTFLLLQRGGQVGDGVGLKAIFTLIGCILILFAWAGSAIAGNITLNFELRDKKCFIANRGDSTAYYPVVTELDSSGQWIPLKTDLHSSELLPGGSISTELAPSAGPANGPPDITALRIVMAGFFDQAGVSFGQVAVLRSPPASDYKIKAAYSGKHLQLAVPAGTNNIQATWVIAPREEGIAPALGPQSFTYNQPPATRIDWKKTSHAEIETGAALPSVMLVHETPGGFALQTVQKGKIKKSEQRTLWLNFKRPFYIMAALLGICGIFLLLYVRRADDSCLPPPPGS